MDLFVFAGVRTIFSSKCGFSVLEGLRVCSLEKKQSLENVPNSENCQVNLSDVNFSCLCKSLRYVQKDRVQQLFLFHFSQDSKRLLSQHHHHR